MKRVPGLAVVLLLLSGNLLLGAATKQPCTWDGRQYTHMCYTDLLPLYNSEHLDGNRLPFIDQCPRSEPQCDEYPVLTMYAMRLAAWVGPHNSTGFYYANVLLLILCAVAVTLLLYLMAGTRVLYFVLAPTLAIYGFMNWDLIAVALATGATYAYLKKRDAWSGILIGLGVAAKLYPVLLLVPFALGRFREGRRRQGWLLLAGAAGAWLVVNVPFAIASFGSWFHFFSFNSARPPDWDSMWFVGCHLQSGALSCLSGSVKIVNAISLLAFIGTAVLVWFLKRNTEPDFPRWTFAMPFIILFLLTNKVYSPQYSLWLLPWFALVLPRPGLFVAFELADVAVWVTRFKFFGSFEHLPGSLPYWPFQTALLVRAVILLGCVGAWVVTRAPRPLTDPAPPPDVLGPPPAFPPPPEPVPAR